MQNKVIIILYLLFGLLEELYNVKAPAVTFSEHRKSEIKEYICRN
jgi:hypothetical protein